MHNSPCFNKRDQLLLVTEGYTFLSLPKAKIWQDISAR